MNVSGGEGRELGHLSGAASSSGQWAGGGVQSPSVPRGGGAGLAPRQARQCDR